MRHFNARSARPGLPATRPARTRPLYRRFPGHPQTPGQALAEFALILPIFLFLLLIAVDFGRLFASYVELTNVAREGAAYAQGDPANADQIRAYALQETSTQAQGGEGALTISAACADPSGTAMPCISAAGGSGTGNTVTVTASRSFRFVTPLVGDLFSGGISMSASSTTSVLGLASSSGGSPGTCSTAPSASFTFSVVNRTVSLDASLSGPTTGLCAISSYDWDMGDGVDPWPPIVGRTADYTYSVDSYYTVTLTVSNPAGSSSVSHLVTIGTPGGPSPSPTATPTATPPPTPPPSLPPTCNVAPAFTYAFTGNGNGAKAHQMTFYGSYTGQPAPLSWTWNFGDGASGSGQTDSRNYDAAGTYTVSLTVSNGGCRKTVTAQVTAP